MSRPTLATSIFISIILFTGLAAAQPVQSPTPVQFMSPPTICDLNNPEQMRVWAEYGAVYVSKDIKMPGQCIFKDQKYIDAYLSDTPLKAFTAEALQSFKLRPQALIDLEKAFGELSEGYKSVVRRCNSPKPLEDCTLGFNNDFALRTYKQTTDNWNNNKGKFIEKNQGRLTAESSIAQIVGIEAPDGIKPFMYSYSIPGASQHIVGLAIDVKNVVIANSDKGLCNKDCVAALAKHFWYRTVRGDKYHFTYLGYPPAKLRELGLKTVQCKYERANGDDQFIYWVPNIPNYKGYEKWPCDEVPWPQ